MRPTRVLAAVATAVAALLPIPPALADPSPVRVAYRAPVPGPVIDPYRPPPTPYSPGNRGIDFATTPGEEVVAPAEGEVTFAGPVGGGLHVVVLHPDGIRTSLSFLAAVLVRRGQRVAAGSPVGLAASSLHFGARRGEAYIDPATLLAGVTSGRQAVLVPVGAGRALDAPGEADGLRRLLAGDRPVAPPAPAIAGSPPAPTSAPQRVWSATWPGAPPGLAVLLAVPGSAPVLPGSHP